MTNYAAKGTKFYWTISSVLTEVAQVRSCNRGGDTAVINATNLASTAQEKVFDIPDEGQVTLELILDPANATHTALENDKQSATARAARIIFPDTTQRNFTGCITSYREGGTVGGLLMASVTIEITGAVT